jgi:tRNA (cytidine/uridine-2'-O-)-methyltransferase
MFHIVLVEPEIPPNTGNIIRLAANTGCTLHLIEPLGFSMDDKHMRRAGLDYHEYARCKRHAGWSDAFLGTRPAPTRRMFALTTAARAWCMRWPSWPATGWCSAPKHGAGNDNSARHLAPAQQLRLPMRAGQRSLNLSNAVAVTVFEAWRQNGFA